MYHQEDGKHALKAHKEEVPEAVSILKLCTSIQEVYQDPVAANENKAPLTERQHYYL